MSENQTPQINHVVLNFEQFCEEFRPVNNHIDKNASFQDENGDGIMFETFGEELLAVQAANPLCVWTLVDGADFDDQDLLALGITKDDDGSFLKEDGEPAETSLLSNGQHLCNRIGYFITEKPAEPNTQYDIYLDEDVAKYKASLADAGNSFNQTN